MKLAFLNANRKRVEMDASQSLKARFRPKWTASKSRRSIGRFGLQAVFQIGSGKNRASGVNPAVPGIGDKKLEHYGDEPLALVKAVEG